MPQKVGFGCLVLCVYGIGEQHQDPNQPGQSLDGAGPMQTGPPPCRGLFRGVASPAVLCHKEPARASKAPFPRWFFMA